MYYLNAENGLFLHASFTSMHGADKETYTHKFCTDRTLWEMALVADKNIDKSSKFYPKRVQHYNEFILGTHQLQIMTNSSL